jgi:serine/threonine-protein kinase RsbT
MTRPGASTDAVAMVRDESDVPILRDRVRRLGREQGLSHVAIESLATAASEIARNMLDHAGDGVAILHALSVGTRRGVLVTFRDTGCGIADLELALQDGYSSRGGLGLGLAGARRMVDEFSIESTPGLGTVVTLKQWCRAAGTG